MTSTSLPKTHRAAESIPPKFFQTIHTNPAANLPPIPKSGIHTVIRVHTASINPADHKLASLPWPLSRLIFGTPPATPGADFVGHVYATNDSRLAVGDAVWGRIEGGPMGKYGTCADYVVLKGTAWGGKVPVGFKRDLEEFGVFGVAGLSAFKALVAGEIGFAKEWKATGEAGGRGGKVFINGGSGGVGTYMVQMAKHGMGCEAVVASCSGTNADLVKSLGADEVIDYRASNVTEALKSWCSHNGGQKFDLVVDNVGSDAQLYWQSEHYLKPGTQGGRFVMVGGGTSVKQIVDVTKIFLWPSKLGGGQRPFQFLALLGVSESEWKQLTQWIANGTIKSVIEDGNRFSLDQIAKAFEKLGRGRTRGKIAIRVFDEE